MYEFHPASMIFPMMSEEETDGLTEDIRKHGLRDKIVLGEGKILDGRNDAVKSSCRIRHATPISRGRFRTAGVPMRSKSDGMKASHKSGERKKVAVTCKLREVLRCRKCGWSWKRQNDSIETTCPNCGHKKDSRHRTGGSSDIDRISRWKAKNPNRASAQNRLRKSVLVLVGKGVVQCVRCGCDRPELLEVNHKNGGGAAEMRDFGHCQKFYRAIIALERSTDDLELCCRVCNALHYLELIHGPLPYSVTYGGQK